MTVSEIAIPPRTRALAGPTDPAPDFARRRPIGPASAASTVLALVGDTFRQAMAGRILPIALALAALGVATCLSIRVEGPRTLKPDGAIELLDGANRPLTAALVPLGRMTLGFGLVSVGNFRDAPAQVRFLQALLARWAVGVAGILILLAGTAGILPDFLKPEAASVLLAKPVPRWLLLAGKVAGTWAFVAALTGLFVVGTWAALGVRTGVWSTGYLATWPLLVAQFAGLHAASVVAATCTRNASASLFASLACWMVALGTNGARDQIQTLPPSTVPPAARAAVEAAYWALPKPIDLSGMLDRSVSASDHFAVVAEGGGPATSRRSVALWLASTLGFAAVMLGVAGRQLATTDY